MLKLWLRAGDQLTKRRAEVILHLLATTHGSAHPNAIVGVLDVPRHNLVTPTRLVPGIDALLRGEAASFEAMWAAL